jgi:molecular chaperone DnaK
MSRETIDLGIDLGTTNSCAAVCGTQGPKVIRVGGRDYMPSVVYKKGNTTYVGDKAYQTIGDERKWNDVQYEFKRMMGSLNPYHFSSAGITMTAEELSSEVLKELSAEVERELSEKFHAAVITVPAWFESVQREATLRAGQGAGFDEVVLLQEPVAASLGYGYGLNNTEKETWLVFDLGGGTLDVAMVESVEGELRVINHLGNNYCGGKDLDWLILESLIFPKLSKKYTIPNFSKTDKFWRLLKPLAEQAKIELSSRTVTQIDTDQDGVETIDGTPIRTVLEITRDEYESMITTWIDDAIQYGADLIKDCGLSSSKIARTLLVGGPTYTPLLRRRIVERLGIPAEIQAIDPMTVVALGASVFAGTRNITSNKTSIITPGKYSPVTLHYKPVYADIDPMISGQITDDNSVSTIEIVREDGGWTSGRITLLNYTFMTRVILERNIRNTFKIHAYDSIGKSVSIHPSTFVITHGLDVAPPTCPMSYKLPVQEQDKIIADVLIAKGQPLPCSVTREYRTTKAVKANSKDEVIRINLAEGEFDTLDFNNRVGIILINGDSITRNLPEGSEVHVTLNVDENGIPSIKAYVPFLEKHYGGEVLTNNNMQHIDHHILKNNLTDDNERVDAITEEIENETITIETQTEIKHDAIQVKKELSEIQNIAPNCNQEDLQKIERKRKALAERINNLAISMEIPRAIAELKSTIEWAAEIVENHGNPEDNSLFNDYNNEANKAIETNNLIRIKSVDSEITGIGWRILFRIDDFWIGTFQRMCKDIDSFTNQQQANSLIQIGRQALSRQDIKKLKEVVRELWDYYPATNRLETSRRFETDLRMA